MAKSFSKFIFILLIVLLGCGADFPDNEKITGYNLSKPDNTFILPDILHEISGIVSINNNLFACVQDEKGIVFIYDSSSKKIIREIYFGEDGDYEGIAKVGNTIFVLRSDGALYEITNFKTDNSKVNFYNTGIPAKDNEGLCFDKTENRILIGCKSNIGKGPVSKVNREIYSFNFETKTLSKRPAFTFNLEVINKFAKDNGISLPSKKKKKDQSTEFGFKFRTSAIAIHPITNKLFLLSAADHLLFVFNLKGNIEHIERLNPEMFNKAEGITFLDNGDMFISNEGEDKKPTLLKFNYKTK